MYRWLAMAVLCLHLASWTTAAAEGASDATLDIKVLSRGHLQVIVGRAFDAVPSPEALAAWREARWAIESVRRTRDETLILEVRETQPAAHFSTWTLRLPLDLVQRLIPTGHPVRDVRLVVPNVLDARWLTAQPGAALPQSMSYTGHSFAATSLEEIAVELAERRDLPDLTRRAVLWAMLPVATGWLLPAVLMRRNSSGRLPPIFNLMVPFVLASMIPFHTYYGGRFVGLAEWRLGAGVLSAWVGFAPYLVVYVLALYPIVGRALGTLRGMKPWERSMSRRMAIARTLPMAIAAVLNVILIFSSNFAFDRMGHWRLLAVESAIILFGLLLSPLLVRWVFLSRQLDGPVAQDVFHLAHRARVAIRGVFVIPGRATVPFLNALAVGLLPGQRMIFFSEDLVERFEPQEVQAIAAHEIGHLGLPVTGSVRCTPLLAVLRRQPPPRIRG